MQTNILTIVAQIAMLLCSPWSIFGLNKSAGILNIKYLLLALIISDKAYLIQSNVLDKSDTRVLRLTIRRNLKEYSSCHRVLPELGTLVVAANILRKTSNRCACDCESEKKKGTESEGYGTRKIQDYTFSFFQSHSPSFNVESI